MSSASFTHLPHQCEHHGLGVLELLPIALLTEGAGGIADGLEV